MIHNFHPHTAGPLWLLLDGPDLLRLRPVIGWSLAESGELLPIAIVAGEATVVVPPFEAVASRDAAESAALAEVTCPGCGVTIRARMADSAAEAGYPELPGNALRRP